MSANIYLNVAGLSRDKSGVHSYIKGCKKKQIRRISSLLFGNVLWEWEAIQQINAFVIHIQKPKFKSSLSLNGNKLGNFNIIPSEMYSPQTSMAQHSSSFVQEKPHTEHKKCYSLG